MALNRSKNYGTRWETSSEESPQGKFKDKSSETAVDGSYLQKSWINDISDGWNGAILKGYTPTQEQLDAVNPLGFNNNAGVIGTPVNEIIDKANDSQVYNAWYKHTQEISNTVAQDVVDTTISNKQIEEKIATLEAEITELETEVTELETEVTELETEIAGLQVTDDGCYFNWYAGDNAIALSSNSNGQWLDFENLPNQNATPPVITKNNFTLDSNTPKRLVFNRSGNYSIKIVMFLALSETLGSINPIAGKLKIFKNYEGSDSTKTENLLFELKDLEGFVIHAGSSTDPAYASKSLDSRSSYGQVISGVCLVPVDFFNINKDDFLTIHADYRFVGNINAANMTMELSVIRAGKVIN